MKDESTQNSWTRRVEKRIRGFVYRPRAYSGGTMTARQYPKWLTGRKKKVARAASRLRRKEAVRRVKLKIGRKLNRAELAAIFARVAALLLFFVIATAARAQQITVTNAANYQSDATPDSIASAFTDTQLTPAVVIAQSNPLPFALLGVSVQIDGQFCRLFGISPYQVNFHVPRNVAPGQHKLIITGGYGTPGGPRTIGVLFAVRSVAPALFTRNQAGFGEAAADFEQRGDLLIVSLYGLGIGVAVDPSVARFDRYVTLIMDSGEYKAVYAGPNYFTGQTQINFVLWASDLSVGEVKKARLRSCVSEGLPAQKCWDSQLVLLKR